LTAEVFPAVPHTDLFAGRFASKRHGARSCWQQRRWGPLQPRRIFVRL